MRGLPSVGEVTVVEPRLGREVAFVGAPLAAVLDAAVGEGWRTQGGLRFECSDAYQVTLPPARLARGEPWLVWDRADGTPFRIETEKGPVELGPYNLIWTAPVDGAPVATDYWPYAVTTVRAFAEPTDASAGKLE